MKSQADQLPPDIASQIDPAWRKNEADYWAVRDQLLGQYEGQWIGFANGSVIASGNSPVAVFHAAEASGSSPFVTCVGHESEPCRKRRGDVSYDRSMPNILPWRFPNEQDRVYQEARQFRQLSSSERLERIFNLIAFGQSFLASSPNRAAARRLRERDEEEWRRRFHELFVQYESRTGRCTA